MIVDVALEPEDAPGFILAVTAIAASLMHDVRAAELRLVRIDGWFDFKWLRYSGKGLVPHWAAATTVPPFTPARVRAEHRYRRVAPDAGVPDDGAAPLHDRRRAPSRANIRRPIVDRIDDGAMLWFSSASAVSLRGSVMTYVAHGGVVEGWYASFVGTPRWRLGRVKGIDRQVVTRLLGLSPP